MQRIPLSENIIELVADRINWTELSKMLRFSNSFMDKHFDKINWEMQLHYFPDSELSENISNKICEKTLKRSNPNWNMISRLKLSPDFIEEHKNKLNWNVLISNKGISESLLRNCINKIDLTSSEVRTKLILYQNLNEDFLEQYGLL